MRAFIRCIQATLLQAAALTGLEREAEAHTLLDWIITVDPDNLFAAALAGASLLAIVVT